MLVVYGILVLQNIAVNYPTQLFIYSQGFKGIKDFSMLRIKDLLRMIKDNNLVPNQEARLGAIQRCT